MSRSAKNFYKILEVDSEASSEVIEVAYKRLARRYHPDLNPNKDATVKMQELNEAYSVLSDPQQRISYDLYLRAQAEPKKPRATSSDTRNSNTQPNNNSRPKPESEQKVRTEPRSPYEGANLAMPTTCQECGKSDASLRFASFPYVVSLLLFTFRRGEGGLYCSACRRNKMNGAKVITLLLGWWGIPWGPIYTLGTLFTSSEGVIDAKSNADYLRWLGGYFVHTGNLVEAKHAIQASLNLNFDPELAAVAHSIFGSELIPPPSKPQQHWGMAVFIAVMLGWILFAVFDVFEIPSQPSSVTASTGSTSNVTVTAPSSSAKGGGWSKLKSKAGIAELEYPSNWMVLEDTEEVIELQGKDASFTLFLISDNTGDDINTIIKSSKTDQDFTENYNRPLREYVKAELDKLDGTISSFSSPVIEDIGDHSTIYNDITYSETVSGKSQRKRMLLYFFDCGRYMCQVIYSMSDAKPVTEEQRQLSEHMITSVKIGSDTPIVPAPQPPSKPRPTQVADSSDVFSGLSFCYEKEFSAVGKRCTRHHDVFTGTVEKLYVSWTPSKEYRDASFLKKWYIDGKHFLDSESTNNYGYLEIDTRTSLKPGSYMVDLYVSDKLVARGNFTIR